MSLLKQVPRPGYPVTHAGLSGVGSKHLSGNGRPLKGLYIYMYIYIYTLGPPPVMLFLTPFVGWEASPTKLNYRKRIGHPHSKLSLQDQLYTHGIKYLRIAYQLPGCCATAEAMTRGAHDKKGQQRPRTKSDTKKG